MSPLVERYESSTIKVKTPDGTMFVIFDEDDNLKLVNVRIMIGKAGTNLMAWCETVGRLLTLAINHDVLLEEIQSEISLQTSNKLVLHRQDIPIRSGPEGLAYAIMQYRRDRAERLERKSITINDRRRRPAKFENVDR